MKVWIRGMGFDPKELVAVGRAAEDAGFYGLGMQDHLLYPQDLSVQYPYADAIFPQDLAWSDPWVTFGALSEATETLQFCTWIYLAAARSPFDVAKAVATASLLSGGRVSFGAAAGWLPEEYEISGLDFSRRGARLDEVLVLLRKIWAGGWVEHHGEFFDLKPSLISPTPAAPIPIWSGGDSPAAIRRAAGQDGWLGIYYDFDDAIDRVTRLNAFREQAGTADREDFEVMCNFIRVPTADELKRLEEIGVTSIILAPWEREFPQFHHPGLDNALRHIDDYAETVAAAA
jgi:probable F420-dependent oxidoreductase